MQRNICSPLKDIKTFSTESKACGENECQKLDHKSVKMYLKAACSSIPYIKYDKNS